MNKQFASFIKATFTLLFIALSGVSVAQTDHRVFNFKQGDEYQTDILTNSRAVVQRGKQTLNVNTVSTITKSYKVSLANERGYTIGVNIKRIDNVIDAMGEQFHFDSDNVRDTASFLKKAYEFMLNKPVDVAINKYGIIQSFTDYKAEMATDTLVAFAGMQPEIFEKGTLIGLVADLNHGPNLHKGFTWADSVVINSQTLKSKFWIEDVNEKHTIVKFSTTTSGRLLNSNTNGTYVVENETGIILEKLLYIVTTGYQISRGRVVYAVSRSTSVSEKTRKVR